MEMRVYIIRRYFWHHYLLRSACVLCVWPRWPIVGHNKGLEIQASGFLPGCGGPPAISLKTAMLQLRLRYTTMWCSHTRANICDPGSAFKYGSADRSSACLGLTSLNTNECALFQTNASLALHWALLCFIRPVLTGLITCLLAPKCTEFTRLSVRVHTNKGLAVIIADNKQITSSLLIFFW